MEIIAWQLQLLLLASCWRTSLLVPCPDYKRGDACGCTKSLTTEKISSDWTREDSEYFFIDDMAFKKSKQAQGGYSKVPPSRLNIMLWPGGIVFYIIDEKFDWTYRSKILDAMKIIQRSVGSQYLEFREARRADGTICRNNYLHIVRNEKRECSSHVGMVPPDRNNKKSKKSVTVTSLHQEACSSVTIQHELLHALGRRHEQSRPDRDQHVNLKPSSMSAKECHNFKLSKTRLQDNPSHRLRYDSQSIMHYDSCDFSCDGYYTMVYKNGSRIAKNRKAMTKLDIEKMRVLYPTKAKVRYTDALCRGCSHASSIVSLITCLAISTVVRLAF